MNVQQTMIVNLAENLADLLMRRPDMADPNGLNEQISHAADVLEAILERIQPKDRRAFAAQLARRMRMDLGAAMFAFAVGQLAAAAAQMEPGLPRTCRHCGCTHSDACPGGCSWSGKDVCSACVQTFGLAKAKRKHST